MRPTAKETEQRERVIARVLHAIRHDEIIKLPAFDPALSRPSDRVAFQSVGIEPNEFCGTLGAFRYQFEGEEDLLHIVITRLDGSAVRVEEARRVVSFLVPNVSPAVIWLKPGEFTQHFYFGHDELMSN